MICESTVGVRSHDRRAAVSAVAALALLILTVAVQRVNLRPLGLDAELHRFALSGATAWITSLCVVITFTWCAAHRSDGGRWVVRAGTRTCTHPSGLHGRHFRNRDVRPDRAPGLIAADRTTAAPRHGLADPRPWVLVPLGAPAGATTADAALAWVLLARSDKTPVLGLTLLSAVRVHPRHRTSRTGRDTGTVGHR